MYSLTLSWRRSLSYRNQSIDLHSESRDWFLYYGDLRYERTKHIKIFIVYNTEFNFENLLIKDIFPEGRIFTNSLSYFMLATAALLEMDNEKELLSDCPYKHYFSSCKN